MYLFAYGTLQPAANLNFYEDNDLVQFLDFVSRGVIQGDLVHMTNTKQKIEYPGAINVGESDSQIFGTLFKVANIEKAFEVMDEHEGFTDSLSLADSLRKNFYQRIEAEARRESGEKVKVQVYVLNRESDYYQQDFIIDNGLVSGGDWLTFISK